MNDCRSAAMRDKLPDLLHDRLSESERAVVAAHVEACADCREELLLLRKARHVLLAATPRVDTAWVVNALPKPPSQPSRTVVPLRPRRSWADWRIAATITVLAGGATSAALLSRSHGAPPVIDTVAVAPAPVPVARPESALVTPVSPAVAPSPARVSRSANEAASSKPAPEARVAAVDAEPAEMGSAVVSDPETAAQLKRLDSRQLQSLLKDIEGLKAVPVTEPEPAMIKVEARSSSGAAEEF